MKTQRPSSLTSSNVTPLTRPKQVSISALAEKFAALRLQKEEAEDSLKKINEQLASIEDHLVDLMESSELTALKTEQGHGLSLRGACYPTVKNKEEFNMWIHANGYEDALTMHPSTLKSLCKELLEEAKPLPDGVEAYMKSRITFRRGR